MNKKITFLLCMTSLLLINGILACDDKSFCTDSLCKSDINNDKIVDFGDFHRLARDYGKLVCEFPEVARSDLNKNGLVDYFDFLILKNHWRFTIPECCIC